jgi:oligo-1,6-glucosidase
MGKKEQWITYDSTVGELYHSPVGHDALARILLQLGIPERAITNRAVSSLRLRTIANLTKRSWGWIFLTPF